MQTQVVDTVRRDVALLYRRFGFGATAAELDAAAKAGYDATVDRLLQFGGPDAADAKPLPALAPDAPLPADAAGRAAERKQRNAEGRALLDWWLDRMVTSSKPAAEKLTFFWHGHFATAVSKVRVPALMATQNAIFRTLGAGAFTPLVQAVAKDPAMLVWLDSNSNVKEHPNENFARELMELFTLGIGNYSETDVREAARCFTGWSYDRTVPGFRMRPARHDDGSKTVLGRTGNLGGEDIVDLVANSATSARFVTSRLWSRYAFPIAPDDPIVTSIIATSPRTIADTLRAIARHPEFRSPDTFTGLVKQPVEWLVGSLRALGVAYDPKYVTMLQRMGQVPFDPPSVAGWPQNLAWVSTASSLARLTGATQLAAAADLRAISATPVASRPDACARLLGVDQWSPSTAASLATVAGDVKALVALALVSPDHVLN